MMKRPLALLCALPLHLSSPVQAGPLYRCIDTEGRTTFTHLGCPADSEAHEHRLGASNLIQGHLVSGEPSSALLPRAPSAPEEKSRQIVVVGEQDVVCGNLITPTERRQAIIKRQARAGMTRSDVESALGKPDKISSRNGQLRYHYQPRKGASHQVSFDEAGCVKGGR